MSALDAGCKVAWPVEACDYHVKRGSGGNAGSECVKMLPQKRCPRSDRLGRCNNILSTEHCKVGKRPYYVRRRFISIVNRCLLVGINEAPLSPPPRCEFRPCEAQTSPSHLICATSLTSPSRTLCANGFASISTSAQFQTIHSVTHFHRHHLLKHSSISAIYHHCALRPSYHKHMPTRSS